MNRRMISFLLAFVMAVGLVQGVLPQPAVSAAEEDTDWRNFRYRLSAGGEWLGEGQNTDPFDNFSTGFLWVDYYGGYAGSIDLGKFHPGFHIGSGKTVVITASRGSLKVWSGRSDDNLFQVEGGTLYVGKTVKLLKENSYSAAACYNTSKVFCAGNIVGTNALGINTYGGATTSVYCLNANPSTNNEGGQTRRYNYYPLTLSRGAGISSIDNYPPGYLTEPLTYENTYYYGTGEKTMYSSYVTTAAGYSYGGETITIAAGVNTRTINATPNTYTVTFNGAGGTPSQNAKSVTYNSAYGALPTASRPGYEFAGWYTAASGGAAVSSGTTYTTAGNSTLYAHWTPLRFTFNTPEDKTFNGLTASVRYDKESPQDYGTTVKATLTLSGTPTVSGMYTAALSSGKLGGDFTKSVTVQGVRGVPVMVGNQVESSFMVPAENLGDISLTLTNINLPEVVAKSYVYNGAPREYYLPPAEELANVASYTISYEGVGETVYAPSDEPPSVAGTYAVTISFALSSGDTAAATTTLTITKKQLSWNTAALKAVNKQFDGTTDAVLDGTLAVGGVLAGDSVTLEGEPTGTFEDLNAGAGKLVYLKIDQLSLAGEDAGNYQLPPSAPFLRADILGIEPDATLSAPPADGVFAGTGVPLPVASGTYSFTDPNMNYSLNGENDKNVSYTYYTDPELRFKTSPAVGAQETGGAPSYAGNYYVTATFTPDEDQGQYSPLTTAAFPYTVLPKPVAPQVTFPNGGSLIYTGGELRPAVAVSDGGTTLTDQTDYTLTYHNNINANESAPSAYAEIALKGNYSLADGAENRGYFTIARKPYPMDSIALADDTVVYDGQPHGIALPVRDLAALDLQLSTSYHYQGKPGTDYNSGVPPTAVGEYTVTATVTTANPNRCFPVPELVDYTGDKDRYVLTASLTIGYDASITIKFDLNGGNIGGQPDTVVWNDVKKYTRLKEQPGGVPVPVQPGTVLAGWQKDGVIYSLDVIGELVVTGNATYIAVWSAAGAQYKINYQLNGGQWPLDMTPDVVYYQGIPVTLKEPVRPGYFFEGWYENDELTGAAVTVIPVSATGDKKLYAKWMAGAFQTSLVLLADGGGEASVIASSGFGEGKAVRGHQWEGYLRLADGYSIQELTVEVGGTKLESNEYTATSDKTHVTVPGEAVTGPVSVHVRTEAHDYVVSFNGNGASGGTMLDQSLKFNETMQLIPNGFTRENCSFLGWSKDPTAAVPMYTDQQPVVNLTAQTLGKVTLYAVWKASSNLPTSLQNGSFESPVNIRSFSQNYNSGDTNLVWKTTASDKKVEIGSVREGFASGSWNAYQTTTASEGYQFAELNANQVGALYQMVATNPGSKLYWGLDHRGRMGVDVMQLWVGSKQDVETALNQYKRRANVNDVDKELLEKIAQAPEYNGDNGVDITTGNRSWRSYQGEYTVPVEQVETMFAFVSVYAAGGNTCGNLLDNIYFSSVVPVRTVPVSVTVSAGGSVIVRHDGATVADLPTEAGVTSIENELLEKEKELKLTVIPQEGFSYVGAIVNGVYHGAAELPELVWTLNEAMDITVLFGKSGIVTLVPMGGSFNGPLTVDLAVTENNSTRLSAPSKAGHTFHGWHVAEDYAKRLDAGSMVRLVGETDKTFTAETPEGQIVVENKDAAKGLILVADYELIEINPTVIALDANEGSVTDNDGHAVVNGNIQFYLNALDNTLTLPAPARPGYRFLYWTYGQGDQEMRLGSGDVIDYWIENDLPKLSMGNAETIDAPLTLTLTAQWQPSGFGVLLQPNGGVIAAEDYITEYIAGEATPLPGKGKISRPGFQFLGWFDNADCTGPAVDEIGADATGYLMFYAGWEPCAHENCHPSCENSAVCGDCGQVLPATGHDWGEYQSNSNATCYADGTETAVCKNDAAHQKHRVKAGTKLTHSFTSYHANNDATCTSDGTKTADCDHGCGTKSTLSDAGSAQGHRFGGWETVEAATCNHKGVRQRTCGVCGFIEIGVEDPTGHNFSDWSVVAAATCTSDGVEQRNCTKPNCEARETRSVPALGHSYTNYHSNNDATCTSDGTETARCDHDGNHSDTRVQAGSAQGHRFSETWTNDALGHWHVSVCDASGRHDPLTDGYEAHVPDYPDVTTEHGQMCTVCGRKLADPVPKDFEIGGTVIGNGDVSAANALVQLRLGSRVLQTDVADEKGRYSFQHVTPGAYNVVALKEREQTGNLHTVTEMAVVTNADVDCNLVFPNAHLNSKLKVEERTPEVVAGGLDTLAASAGSKEQALFTALTIQLTVQPGRKADEMAAIEAAAAQEPAPKTVETFLDTELTKQVDSLPAEIIPVADHVVELVIPYDLKGKKALTLYRYCDGAPQTLTKLAEKDAGVRDGVFYADTDNNLIYLYAQKFSTYAIAYVKDPLYQEYTVRYATGTAQKIGDKIVPWTGGVAPDVSPSQPGYSFVRWLYNGSAVPDGATYDTLALSDSVQSITLVAEWAEKAYSITYDTNGGQPDTPQSKVKNWTEGGLLPDEEITKNGFTLSYWLYNGIVVNNHTVVSQLIPRDGGAEIQLVAGWTPKGGYTVHYDTNGADAIVPKENVGWTDAALLPAAPVRPGYGFTGWTLQGSGIEVNNDKTYADLAESDTVTSVTLVAGWAESTDNIVRYDAGGGTQFPDKTEVRLTDSGLLPGQEPVRSGYRFLRWTYQGREVTGGSVYGGLTTDPVLTLTAQWEELAYTISYLPGNGDTVPDVTKRWTEDRLLPAEPPQRAGYQFDGWYYNGAQVTNDTRVSGLRIPDGEYSAALTAFWRVRSNYMVHYDTGGGASEILPVQVTWEDTVLPNAEPVRKGYRFEGWTYQDQTVKMTDTYGGLAADDTIRSLTLKAVWTLKDGYTVHYDTAGGSVIADVQVSWTDLVTPASNPAKPGYTFSGWTLQSTGAAVNAADTYEQLAGDDAVMELTLTARYKKNSTSGGGGGGGGGSSSACTLRYETNGGTEYKAETYKLKTVVKLDKTPERGGYTFAGWYADMELSAPVTELTMTGNKTVYAAWKEAGGNRPELNTEEHIAYINGYPDGMVRPEAEITRAETAMIFYRLLSSASRGNYQSNEAVFADCETGDWYYTAVATLVKAGVLYGRSEDIFDPEAPITRAEFAAIAARFDSAAYAGDDLFSDISDNWAREYINRAAQKGWVEGDGDGRFRPDEYISRAEAVTLINNVLGRRPESAEDLLPEMQVWTDNSDPSMWYYLAVQEASNGHSYERKPDGVHETWTELDS